MYDDTVLCRLFESKNVPKNCFLLPNVGSDEHRKIEILSNIFDSPFLLIQSRSASSNASTRHMI